jgi:magnesium transporter
MITFTENKLDSYDVVSKLLKESSFREKGTSYLCYTILDFIVDGYFLVMENIDEKLETVEDQIFSSKENINLENIYKIKKDLLLIQKSIWPQREIINIILRESSPIFNDSYDEFYRNVGDHIYQVKDMIDVFRDIISGIFDIYLTTKSNKMNEIMQFLTMISTLFIPITFIAGVYGMNFKYMPELYMKYGYLAAILLMFIMFASMLVYFKRKKWL